MRFITCRKEDMEMEFDLIGCHPSLANAFRRLMLSEVPSMAIEKVYIYNNTSIIRDEVLAHRLGLIPLKADPRLFQLPAADSEEYNEHDSLEFELKVKCTRKKDAKDAVTPDAMYKNHTVCSGQLKWLPKGKQATMLKDIDVQPVHNDILITKLLPGHELDLKLIAVKGIGVDHAKFQPVATAYYRLLPDIKLNRKVHLKDAIKLQKCFSPGVIGINPEDDSAYVIDARNDMCSRNIYRYPELADAVTISLIRDHFIFNVESLGAMKPEDIFIESVKCLKKKCRTILDELNTF